MGETKANEMSLPNASHLAFIGPFMVTISCAGGRSDTVGNLPDAGAVALIDAGVRSPTAAAPLTNDDPAAPAVVAAPQPTPAAVGEPAAADDSMQPNEEGDGADLDASLPEGAPSASRDAGPFDDLDGGVTPREPSGSAPLDASVASDASVSSEPGPSDPNPDDGGGRTDAGSANDADCPTNAPENGDACGARGPGGRMGAGGGDVQCEYDGVGCSCVGGGSQGTGIWFCSADAGSGRGGASGEGGAADVGG